MSKNMNVKPITGVKKTVGKLEITYRLNSESPCRDTERISALLLSIATSVNFNLYINSLTTGWEKEKIRKELKATWQIKDTNSVKQTLDFIMNEGDRTTYNIMLPHFLSSNNKQGRRECLEKRYMAIALLIKYSDNLSDCLESISNNSTFMIHNKDLEKGILAWDMCQLVTISRAAFDTGYLTEKEAWEYVRSAYRICCNEFQDWEEISKSIFIGSGMRVGKKKWFETMLNLFNKLLVDPHSPLIINRFK